MLRSPFALLIAALLAAAPLAAQPPATQQPPLPSGEALKAEIAKVEEEIRKLKTAPDAPANWKELQKVETELDQIRDQQWQQRQTLRGRAYDLSGMADVQPLKKKVTDLEKRQEDLERAQWREVRNRGEKLFRERHAALAARGPARTPELDKLGLDVLSYPRLDGSTSTEPLAVLITCRCLRSPTLWIGRGQHRETPQNAPFDDLERFLIGQERAEPEAQLFEFTMQADVAAAGNARLAVIINRLLATNASTHDSYLNLVEGRSDLGLLARGPSADELEFARSKKVELEVTPCALDAFVFLVNVKNPVKNLTTKQIREIYSRRDSNWGEFAGERERLTAYQREESSGSQQLMRKLVMKETPLYKPAEKYSYPPNLIGRLMSSTFLELTGDRGGLGYSVYYYERFMSGSPNTRTIAVDGIEPNAETIASRKYPYVSEVFVVTRQNLPPTAPAAKLRAWLLSPEGQAVVEQSGYVPLPLKK